MNHNLWNKTYSMQHQQKQKQKQNWAAHHIMQIMTLGESSLRWLSSSTHSLVGKQCQTCQFRMWKYGHRYCKWMLN